MSETIKVVDSGRHVAFFGACNLLENVKQSEWWTTKDASKLLLGIVGVARSLSQEEFEQLYGDIADRFW